MVVMLFTHNFLQLKSQHIKGLHQQRMDLFAPAFYYHGIIGHSGDQTHFIATLFITGSSLNGYA